MAVLPKNVKEILDKYGLGKESVWDCHGTWVMYHAPIEKIAAAAKVTYDDPIVIEADTKNKTATIMMRGHLPSGASEVTFGEASPANCKNSYPWAMAEKRAKDRLVLKLVGLHGDVYGMDEADWDAETPPAKTEKTATPANDTPSITPDTPSITPEKIKDLIDKCSTKKAIENLIRKHVDTINGFETNIRTDLKQHREKHQNSLAA